MKRRITTAALAAMVWAGSTAVAAETFTYNQGRIAIPDDSAEGATTNVEVNGLSGTIADISFSFDGKGAATNVLNDQNAGLDHPSPSDLIVTLIAPSGTSVDLVQNNSFNISTRNIFYTVFDDEAAVPVETAPGGAKSESAYKPVEMLAAFEDQNPNGTWTLLVIDNAPGDTGGVSRWSLNIETGTPGDDILPFVSITDPPTSGTLRSNRTGITLRGTASDYDGTINFVRARRVPPGQEPGLVPWSLAAKDQANAWTFFSSLDLGENRFQFQALDDAGIFGPIAERIIVRDEPVYNGPKPDFAYLGENSTVQVALTRNAGVVPLALWNLHTGYFYDVPGNWKTLSADVNGDGFYDLVAITPVGDAWIFTNNGANAFVDNFRSASGFVFDEYDGWGVFAGDVNGDGFDDLVQITPDGHLHVGQSNGASIAAPVYASGSGFTYKPNESQWVDIADMNGDAKDDVVFVATNGDVWVALSDGVIFLPPTKWAATGFFRHYRGTNDQPFTATDVFLADINGDGRSDVGFLASDGTAWIARSQGTHLGAPESWGATGFTYAPLLNHGWNIFTGDINADAMEDVLQIDQFGNVTAAYSTGNKIAPGAAKLTQQRMYHNILGPRRVMLENFAE